MATLEDAAETMVVRLKSLDSEIEESGHALRELRERLERTGEEIDEEWSRLADAGSSLLSRLSEERERLSGEVQETLQAAGDARGTAGQDGEAGRSAVAGTQAGLEALTAHAEGLGSGAESMMVEAGESPAEGLAVRAKEIDEAMTRVSEELSAFLQDEVAAALERLADDLHEKCEAVRDGLASAVTDRLQAAFESWEGQVDALEDHVAQQGFLSSHGHARSVVDWALTECVSRCQEGLETTREAVAQATAPLAQLVGALKVARECLGAVAGELCVDLEGTVAAATRARQALGHVRQVLAGYTFVEV